MILLNLSECKALPTPEVLEYISRLASRKASGVGGGAWDIGNELKPSDLFCYLGARFGPPNGLQNITRNDSSDNLIHWDWTLLHPMGLITILGFNMRTEVQFLGSGWDFSQLDRQQFIDHVKRDFAHYGKQMSEIRTKFEDWDLFVNPYMQLKDTIQGLKKEFDSLDLNPQTEELKNPTSSGDEIDTFRKEWGRVAQRYSRGFGLALSLRIMTPVLAESYVNMLLFTLCKPDIRANERVYTSRVRENIDIKVQSLHNTCRGFKLPVDWNSLPCKLYNTVINERNDLLHGNVVVGKLKYGEVYFLGKVPIFKSYQSMWQQIIGVSSKASGIEKVSSDLAAVEGFITYVASCLDDLHRKAFEHMMSFRSVGWNRKDKRVGQLLPDHLIDLRPVRRIEV